MAIAGPWVSWWVLTAARRAGASFSTAVGLGAALGDLATYCVTSVQLAVAHPDATSGVGGATVKFLGIFAITQIPLAVIEGLLTALVVRWLSSRSTVDVHALSGGQRERSMPTRYVWAVLAAIAIMISAPLVARRSAAFVGSDARATTQITQIDPGYRRWFGGWWSPPSSEVESFLFAFQAALGAGVIGFVAGTRRRARGANDQPAERRQGHG
jgi:cobalt transport protein